MKLRHLFIPLLLAAATTQAENLPRPDHVVVVIEENRGYSQIMDALKSDSYIHSLARRGMLFTQSYAVTHPSQPNYLALFSGTTQGSTNNDCPLSFAGDNLASSLADRGLSFASFSELMPQPGFLKCTSGPYQRKHNPVANWQGTRLPPSVNLTFNEFPDDFTLLPTVSFVIPDQNNDMHDGSFYTADRWLKTHIAPYVEWAYQHNSLLILTWDEDNGAEGNRIATLFAGPMIKPGKSGQHIDHYSVLRTLLDFYDVPAINASRHADPIKGVWLKH
ncbi:MAG TPA: acid phosphatase [Gallionella sp.]|nr:alkaline phosphatase family protein [Gallionella sp.]OGS66205.1 MAG: acid phosphatase [Gallionellales bacterium GWA2_54_124]HCI52858.1 acid phosphatase [Gallionella sp.]